MPIEYQYDDALNAVVTIVIDSITESEVLAHLQGLCDADDLPSGFVEIVDFRNADDFTITAQGAARIVRMAPDLFEHKDYRGTVFYAPTNLSFQIAQTYRKLLHTMSMKVKVYRDWDELVAVRMKRLRDGPR